MQLPLMESLRWLCLLSPISGQALNIQVTCTFFDFWVQKWQSTRHCLGRGAPQKWVNNSGTWPALLLSCGPNKAHKKQKEFNKLYGPNYELFSLFWLRLIFWGLPRPRPRPLPLSLLAQRKAPQQWPIKIALAEQKQRSYSRLKQRLRLLTLRSMTQQVSRGRKKVSRDEYSTLQEGQKQSSLHFGKSVECQHNLFRIEVVIFINELLATCLGLDHCKESSGDLALNDRGIGGILMVNFVWKTDGSRL